MLPYGSLFLLHTNCCSSLARWELATGRAPYPEYADTHFAVSHLAHVVVFQPPRCWWAWWSANSTDSGLPASWHARGCRRHTVARGHRMTVFGVEMWPRVCPCIRLPRDISTLSWAQHPHAALQDVPYKVVKEGLRPRFPSDTPLHFKLVAQECWSAQPGRRPTAAALVNRLQRLLDLSCGLAQPGPNGV